MKHKGEIVFTAEWFMAVLSKYMDLPEDFELHYLCKDTHSDNYVIYGKSAEFRETPEGAPYYRHQVRTSPIATKTTFTTEELKKK